MGIDPALHGRESYIIQAEMKFLVLFALFAYVAGKNYHNMYTYSMPHTKILHYYSNATAHGPSSPANFGHGHGKVSIDSWR